jgi:hypothetical protein
MLTVTTDPDLYRNELFRTPLRANYIAMKCLGLPRTELEADFLVSKPTSETRRWATRFPGVSAFRYLLAKGGVAVTVAVQCSTSATFQALTSGPRAVGPTQTRRGNCASGVLRNDCGGLFVSTQARPRPPGRAGRKIAFCGPTISSKVISSIDQYSTGLPLDRAEEALTRMPLSHRYPFLSERGGRRSECSFLFIHSSSCEILKRHILRIPAESARGISPRAAHRSVRDALTSYGSCIYLGLASPT